MSRMLIPGRLCWKERAFEPWSAPCMIYVMVISGQSHLACPFHLTAYVEGLEALSMTWRTYHSMASSSSCLAIDASIWGLRNAHRGESHRVA